MSPDPTLDSAILADLLESEGWKELRSISYRIPSVDTTYGASGSVHFFHPRIKSVVRVIETIDYAADGVEVVYESMPASIDFERAIESRFSTFTPNYYAELTYAIEI